MRREDTWRSLAAPLKYFLIHCLLRNIYSISNFIFLILMVLGVFVFRHFICFSHLPHGGWNNYLSSARLSTSQSPEPVKMWFCRHNLVKDVEIRKLNCVIWFSRWVTLKGVVTMEVEFEWYILKTKEAQSKQWKQLLDFGQEKEMKFPRTRRRTADTWSAVSKDLLRLLNVLLLL